MTLHQWFIKNTKTPLAVLGAFVTLIYFFFAYYAVRVNQEYQYNNFRNLIMTSVNIGIQQNNRELIESSLARSVDTLRAKAAFLCQNGAVLISTKVDIKNCADIPRPNFLNRLIKFNVSGFNEYELQFVAPKYSLHGAYLWILIATFLVLLASAWIIVRIRQKFIEDILIPMENNLLTDGDIGIYEFQRIRGRIKELSAIKEKEAFEDAVLESKKAFSHNVKSPLRNLKLIRQKFQNSFDLDDHELFDSAINQISSMADKFTVKSFKRNKKTMDTNSLAISDIDEVLKECIKKKLFEWRGIDETTKLRFYSHATAHTSAVIDSNEMRALLSNILNNAIEAKASNVELALNSDDSALYIDIKDDGVGVPESIRGSLFEEGITAGKKGGTGFGLYHARKCLSRWGGRIELIESRARFTHFRLKLPLWKSPQINIESSDTVVILDDKPSEAARIKKSVDASQIQNPVKCFTSASTFLSWFKKHKHPDQVALLADYDLGDDSPNGIELIQSLGLEKRSILITDNYEDDRLYSQCLSIGVSLAPKSNVERLSFLFP